MHVQDIPYYSSDTVIELFFVKELNKTDVISKQASSLFPTPPHLRGSVVCTLLPS